MWECTISTNTRSVLYPLLPWWRLCATPHLRRNWWTSPWMIDTEAVSLHLLLVMKCISHLSHVLNVRICPHDCAKFQEVSDFCFPCPDVLIKLSPRLYKLYFLKTNIIFHPRALFEDEKILFPRWDMLVSWSILLQNQSGAKKSIPLKDCLPVWLVGCPCQKGDTNLDVHI